MFGIRDGKTKRPDARTAITRTIILARIHAKAAATPPEEYITQVAQKWTPTERDQFISAMRAVFTAEEKKLRAGGMWGSMSKVERDFMQTGPFETTIRQRIDASWLAESIGCLLWALGHLDQLLPYDTESSERIGPFLRGANAKDLVTRAKLRKASEIDQQRDWAELWHWRCRTRTLLETGRMEPVLPNGMKMEEVIAMASAKAAAAGAFNAPTSDDFPAFSKPFRELSESEFISVTSIAQERHKAFNWLCGYSPRNEWDETPTDT